MIVTLISIQVPGTAVGQKREPTPKRQAEKTEREKREEEFAKFEAAALKKHSEDRMAEQQRIVKEIRTLETGLSKADGDKRAGILFQIAVLWHSVGKAESGIPRLKSLIEEYPKSTWSSNASVLLFDLYLFVQQDLSAASELLPGSPTTGGGSTAEAGAGVSPGAGAEQTSKERAGTATDNSSGRASSGSPRTVPPVVTVPGIDLPPLQGATEPLSEVGAVRAWKHRRELVGWLTGTLVAEKDPGYGPGLPPFGLQSFWSIFDQVRSKPITALGLNSLVALDANVPWRIRLAEVLFFAGDCNQAMQLLERVLASKKDEFAPAQKSLALFRRAQCVQQAVLNRTVPKSRANDVVTDFLHSQTTFPEAPWGTDALFLAGNVHNNLQQDFMKAVEVWSTMHKHYPNAPLTERAEYQIGTVYQFTGQTELAKSTFKRFRERFPKSIYSSSLNSEGLDANIKPNPQFRFSR